jgi:hypothetical protein
MPRREQFDRVKAVSIGTIANREWLLAQFAQALRGSSACAM